jgi:hypothetical protein
MCRDGVSAPVQSEPAGDDHRCLAVVYLLLLVRDLIPLDYRCGLTSFSLVGQRFDAVFIDGDHTFEWAWADYQNVGRGARVCGIHDVMSQFYLENEETGGVTTAWELIKQAEGGPGVHFEEYCHHPKGNLFGIGIRARRE